MSSESDSPDAPADGSPPPMLRMPSSETVQINERGARSDDDSDATVYENSDYSDLDGSSAFPSFLLDGIAPEDSPIALRAPGEFYLLKRSDFWHSWETRRFVIVGSQLQYWRPSQTEEYSKARMAGAFELRGAQVSMADATESLLWITVECEKVEDGAAYVLQLQALDRETLVRVLRAFRSVGASLDDFLSSQTGLEDDLSLPRAAADSANFWPERPRVLSSFGSVGALIGMQRRGQAARGRWRSAAHRAVALDAAGRGLFAAAHGDGVRGAAGGAPPARGALGAEAGVGRPRGRGGAGGPIPPAAADGPSAAVSTPAARNGRPTWDESAQEDAMRYLFEMPPHLRIDVVAAAPSGAALGAPLGEPGAAAAQTDAAAADAEAERFAEETRGSLQELQTLVDKGAVSQETFEKLRLVAQADLAERRLRSQQRREAARRDRETEREHRARRRSAVEKHGAWPRWEQMPRLLRRGTAAALEAFPAAGTETVGASAGQDAGASAKNPDPALTPPDHEGYLLKRSDHRGDWRTRLFRLSGALLSYTRVGSDEDGDASSGPAAGSRTSGGPTQRSRAASKAAGEFVVAGAVARFEGDPQARQFTVMCRKRGERDAYMLTLQALDVHDLHAWLGALRARAVELDPGMRDFLAHMDVFSTDRRALDAALAKLREWQEGRESIGWVTVGEVLAEDERVRYRARIMAEVKSSAFLDRVLEAFRVAMPAEDRARWRRSAGRRSRRSRARERRSQKKDNPPAGGRPPAPPPRDGLERAGRRRRRGSSGSSAGSFRAGPNENGGGPNDGADASPVFRGNHAVFVLGPSAAGKTYTTRHTLLRNLLVKNGWDGDLGFFSIDGGTIRDESLMWQEMKEIPAHSDARYSGFSDLFSEYFQPHISVLKKKLFAWLLKRRMNIIVPDTCVSIKNKIAKRFSAFQREGYRIVMTAVYASKAACTAQGRSREKHEGKRYSNNSWVLAMHKIPALFNLARDKGVTDETFFITDNTDHANVVTVEVPPHHYVRVQWQFEGLVPVHAKFEAVPMARSKIDFSEMRVAKAGWLEKLAGGTSWGGIFGRKWDHRWFELRRNTSLVWLIWYNQRPDGAGEQSAKGGKAVKAGHGADGDASSGGDATAAGGDQGDKKFRSPLRRLRSARALGRSKRLDPGTKVDPKKSFPLLWGYRAAAAEDDDRLSASDRRRAGKFGFTVRRRMETGDQEPRTFTLQAADERGRREWIRAINAALDEANENAGRTEEIRRQSVVAVEGAVQAALRNQREGDETDGDEEDGEEEDAAKAPPAAGPTGGGGPTGGSASRGRGEATPSPGAAPSAGQSAASTSAASTSAASTSAASTSAASRARALPGRAPPLARTCRTPSSAEIVSSIRASRSRPPADSWDLALMCTRASARFRSASGGEGGLLRSSESFVDRAAPPPGPPPESAPPRPPLAGSALLERGEARRSAARGGRSGRARTLRRRPRAAPWTAADAGPTPGAGRRRTRPQPTPPRGAPTPRPQPRPPPGRMPATKSLSDMLAGRRASSKRVMVAHL